MVLFEDPSARARLARLQSFLQDDPDNPSLLADVAEAAFEVQDFATARECLDRLEVGAPLTPPLLNLKGLIALAENRAEEALPLFAALRSQGLDHPSTRFNEAWALALLSRYEEADMLLDDGVLAASPRAPALKVQMLHHLGRLDEAWAEVDRLAERFPEDPLLFGRLAMLAMDGDRPDRARDWALRAGNSAAGLTVRGMFALDDQQQDEALSLFDQALAVEPRNPRALIGKGLALLNGGSPAEAARSIDQGAAIFATHSGSWIASGWAYFLSGQLNEARARFEHAVEIEPSFSEGHGGLAVLDLVEGNKDSGVRRSEVALRLDPLSLGGTLSRLMQLESHSQSDLVAALMRTALANPVGNLSLLARLAKTAKNNLPKH